MKYKSTLVFALISIILLTQVSFVKSQDDEAVEEPAAEEEAVVEDTVVAEEAVEEAAPEAEADTTTGIP